MVTFSVCLAILIAGYFLNGRVCERIFGPDSDRETPAHRMADGVDYVQLPLWKTFFVQFLNIAGLGPIFGAVLGAKYGTAVFPWIALGCVFFGAVQDYFFGMISLRYNGSSYPEVVGRLLGKKLLWATRVLTPVMLIVAGAAHVSGPAGLLETLTGPFMEGWPVSSFVFWCGVVFVYYVMATILPIDKIIARIYPFFGATLLFMAVALLGVLFVHMPAIPEAYESLANTHPDAVSLPLFPMLFITVTCGAISGFHGIQSPMMARCLMNEREGRPVFYGAMIIEGIVALVWATVASYVFHTPEGHAFLYSNNAAQIANYVCTTWLGPLGGVLAILGVVAAPVTTGDTSFRAARLILADALKIEQASMSKRLLLALPLFVPGFLLLFIDFEIIWRYTSWANQTFGTLSLWAVTVWLLVRRKNYWIAFVPAVFMTMLVSAYFFKAPEMLLLPLPLSLFLAFVVTAVSVAVFFRFAYLIRRRLRGHAVV